MVKEKKMPYMDAVIDYCKSNDIDVGTINSMVNKSLKEKIKSEATPIFSKFPYFIDFMVIIKISSLFKLIR